VGADEDVLLDGMAPKSIPRLENTLASLTNDPETVAVRAAMLKTTEVVWKKTFCPSALQVEAAVIKMKVPLGHVL
jgi:hypothetical protein